ncbi:MAG: clostripain-related cysteine peptidase, partial [Thermoplasmata archaeon]
MAISPLFQMRADAQDEAETWTFMVYMSGDSSLSDQIPSDLQEMKKVGSGENLDIIVLLDSAGDGDSSLARILKNGREDLSLSSIDPTWGSELNMGDPDTLVQYVSWVVENYPADRFMLDLWGHGNGWPGVCPDKGDYLTAAELRYAMMAISDADINLDIISMDACQMG